MFTGLIASTGSIVSIKERRGTRSITISAPALKLSEGDSVAVSGVCLTALEIVPGKSFSADLAAETVARSSLASLAPGSIVNLELPTPAGTPLGGHIVQGHVDGTGTLLELALVNPEAREEIADRRLRVTLPPGLSRYIVEKGSIAVEGISLTIAHWEPEAGENGVIEIAIIPHTYAQTNLYTLKPGSRLNLEADVMLKFFEQRRRAASESLTVHDLIANGY